MNTSEELRIKAIELSLQRISSSIEDLQSTIVDASLLHQVPAFCTLEQACQLKGGSLAKNLHKRRWMQPCCGTNYKRWNGCRVWPRSEIIRWLSITDDLLEAYAADYGIDISRYFRDGKNTGAA